MANELETILNGFPVPLTTADQTLQELLRYGETNKHKWFGNRNLKLLIMDSRLIPIEDCIFKCVSLKTERSRPNSGRNAIMVSIYYCPVVRPAPTLLLKAEIDFDRNFDGTPITEETVGFDPFEELKDILFIVLNNRYVYYWARTEDLVNLHITPEELDLNNIRGLDLSTTDMFRNLYQRFGTHSLMILVWTYSSQRIQDIDSITTDMSFGYECSAKSAGIMFVAIQLNILFREYERSGYSTHQFHGYNDIVRIWIKCLRRNVLNLNPLRLEGLTQEEAQNILNKW